MQKFFSNTKFIFCRIEAAAERSLTHTMYDICTHVLTYILLPMVVCDRK